MPTPFREIQELSQTEFDALSTDQVGQGRHGLGGKKSSCLICVLQKENPFVFFDFYEPSMSGQRNK